MKNDDLNNYKDDLWELERRLKAKSRVETVLKLYSVFGALIGIFSLAYFLLSLLKIELTESQTLTLIIAGTSITLSLASWGMLLFRKQRELEESKKIKSFQNATKFMYLWTEFEISAKEKLEATGIDFSKHSIRSVIKVLYENNYITKKEAALLDDAMQLRNSIAHSRMGSEVSPELIARVSEVLLRTIEKLG
jgi:hypothetical protein